MTVPLWLVLIIALLGAIGVPLLIIAMVEVWKRLDYLEKTLRNYGIEW